MGFIKPIFQQGAYDPLETQISNIQKASLKLESAVKWGLHKRLYRVSNGVDNIQRNEADMMNAFVVLLYNIH